VLVLEGLHVPAPHVEAVTVLDCVPVASQKSLKPSQLPQAPVLVPHAVPVVLRVHACVSLEGVPAHVALLVQAYAVTVRDWLPVSSHVSPKPPQLPQVPYSGAAHVVPTALLLQLLVETAGLHSWQATLGWVVPAA
jgi:hypothetical protein